MDNKQHELTCRLIDALDAVLGPALLGALDDDEIIKDYGNLGLSIIQQGRDLLQQTKEEVKRWNENF